MRRILIDRSRLSSGLVALIVLSVALQAQTVAAADESATRAFAREHFARGIALAKAHAYAEALREFQRAYDAAPHFAVLYNIGQAELALGESASGVATLERYLAEGGANIEALRKAEVEAIIAQHRKQTEPASAAPLELARPRDEPISAGSTEPVTPPQSTPVVPRGGAAPVSGAAPATFSASRPALRPLVRTSPEPGPVSDALPPSAHASTRKTLAYVVGATGLALAAGALGHFLWNRDRYQEWQGRFATYYRDPRDSNRQSANDLAESIARASTVTVALAVASGIALSSGTVLFVTSSAGGASSRSAGGFSPVVTVKGSF